MLVVPSCLDRFQVADAREAGPGNPAGAFLGPIKQPEVQWVHAQLLAYLVDHRLHSKSGSG